MSIFKSLKESQKQTTSFTSPSMEIVYVNRTACWAQLWLSCNQVIENDSCPAKVSTIADMQLLFRAEIPRLTSQEKIY